MASSVSFDGATFHFVDSNETTPKQELVGYSATGEPYVVAGANPIRIKQIFPLCVQRAAGTRRFHSYVNGIDAAAFTGASVDGDGNTHVPYASWINGTQVNPGSKSWTKFYRTGEARAPVIVPDSGARFPAPSSVTPGSATLTNSEFQEYTSFDVIDHASEKQGYDEYPRTPSEGSISGEYDDKLNVDPVRLAARGHGNSLVVYAGDSVVKAISHDEIVPKEARGVLQKFVVLSVLASEPAVGDFRPPYACDPAIKLAMPSWNVSDLDYSFLSNVTPPAVDGLITAAMALGYVQRPMELSASDQCRSIAPTLHQAEYGRDIWRQNTRALLWLHHNNSNATKLPVLRAMVQRGIDVWGAVKNGRVWLTNGGHNAKCKTPLVVAALALGDAELATWAQRDDLFQEDLQVFTVQEGGGPGSFDSDILRKHTLDNGAVLAVGVGGSGYQANDLVRLRVGTPLSEDDYPVYEIDATRINGAGAIIAWNESDCERFPRLMRGAGPGTTWPVETITGSGSGATIKIPRTVETRLEHELGSADFYATYNRYSGGGTDAVDLAGVPITNGDFYATYANTRTYDQSYRGTNASNTALNSLAIRMCTGGVAMWNYAPFHEWGDRSYYAAIPTDPYLDWSTIAPTAYEKALWDAHRAMPNPGAPTIVSAHVKDNRVAIIFDQLLHEGYVPSTDDFALSSGSTTIGATYVEVRGRGVLLLTNATIPTGTKVPVTYRQTPNGLRNLAGTLVADINGAVLRDGTGSGAAPVFSGDPVVTGNTAPEGDLNATTGTASGNPLFTRRWFSNAAQTDDTDLTYTKGTADSGNSLSCKSYAMNGYGIATATSNAVVIVAAPVTRTYNFNDADGTKLTAIGFKQVIGDGTVVVDAATTAVKKTSGSAGVNLLTAEGLTYKTQHVTGTWQANQSTQWIGVLASYGGAGVTGYFLRRSGDTSARLSKYTNGIATSIQASIAGVVAGGSLRLEAVVAANNLSVSLKVYQGATLLYDGSDTTSPHTSGATAIFMGGTGAVAPWLAQLVTYAAP
jgi:hypothetical protein